MRGHNDLPDAELLRLPRPAPAAITPRGFICSICQPSPVQQALYQLAFEQAQAVARPSLPERDLAAVWN
ncbi:MAG: hypothetical protein JNM56_27005 [Planctomycetia bacterium]|nr:hypothetical protein [Planctomycetia bacterium]